MFKFGDDGGFVCDDEEGVALPPEFVPPESVDVDAVGAVGAGVATGAFPELSPPAGGPGSGEIVDDLPDASFGFATADDTVCAGGALAAVGGGEAGVSDPPAGGATLSGFVKVVAAGFCGVGELGAFVLGRFFAAESIFGAPMGLYLEVENLL